MITIEDQLRRYASDVAGPPVAAPPADLAEVGGGQPHRGRWLFVAALLVFVLGLAAAVAASRATNDSQSPPVATDVPVPTPPSLPTDLPASTVWADGPATCNDSAPEGVRLAGPDSGGACIGVGTTATAETPEPALWIVHESASMIIPESALVAGYVSGSSGPSFLVYAAPPTATSVVISQSRFRTMVADLIEVPGLEGRKVVALDPPGYHEAFEGNDCMGFMYWFLDADADVVLSGPTQSCQTPNHTAPTTQPPESLTNAPVTAWAGIPTQCTPELSGLLILGADGEGICIGTESPSAEGTDVWFAAEGQRQGSMRVDDCVLARADWSMNSAGYRVGEGSGWFVMVSDQVQWLTFEPPGSHPITAATFELPGLPGVRFAAAWLPNPNGQTGPITQFAASGERYVPEGEAPTTRCSEQRDMPN